LLREAVTTQPIFPCKHGNRKPVTTLERFISWRLVMKLDELGEKQVTAIRSAYADLKGALEAHQAGDRLQHDWKAHEQTLRDMEQAFEGVQK
jgi:hypothetical protein